MRIFPDEVEARQYERSRLREWAAAGLFSKDKLEAAEAALGPAWSQAGWAIRLLLFWLGGKVQSALILFISLFLGWRSFQDGWLLLATGGAALAVSEILIRNKSIYRYGVEESFAVGGVVQIVLGVLVLLGLENILRHHGILIAGLGISLAGAWLYARYGYLYGAYGFVLGVSLMVGGLEMGERETRLWLFAIYALLLALSTVRPVPDFEAETRGSLQAVLALGMAFSANLRLERLFLQTPLPPEWSLAYWASYLAVWAVPAALLLWGLKSRRRSLVAAGVVGVLVAVASNKPYLGLRRYDWDPAILGAVLMAMGAWLTRWLNAGPSMKRHGFTAQPIFVDRESGLAPLAAAAVAFQAGPGAGPAPEKPGLQGGGGSSGGGGASGGF